MNFPKDCKTTEDRQFWLWQNHHNLWCSLFLYSQHKIQATKRVKPEDLTFDTLQQLSPRVFTIFVNKIEKFLKGE